MNENCPSRGSILRTAIVLAAMLGLASGIALLFGASTDANPLRHQRVILTDTDGNTYVALKDGGAVTVTVSGMATAANQVLQRADANTGNAYLADANATLTAINGKLTACNTGAIAGTVTVTGVATAAKQPALGTAGSASADVISIQGVASMTAVKVDGSGVTQPVSASALPLPTGAATAANQVLQRQDANALTTSPVTKAITIIAQTVGEPGTAVALAGSETLARKVYLCATRAAAANSAVVYIGTSAVKNDTARQISLAPADVFVLDPGPGCVVDLAAVYLDGSDANDGVRGWYVPK